MRRTRARHWHVGDGPFGSCCAGEMTHAQLYRVKAAGLRSASCGGRWGLPIGFSTRGTNRAHDWCRVAACDE